MRRGYPTGGFTRAAQRVAVETNRCRPPILLGRNHIHAEASWFCRVHSVTTKPSCVTPTTARFKSSPQGCACHSLVSLRRKSSLVQKFNGLVLE